MFGGAALARTIHGRRSVQETLVQVIAAGRGGLALVGEAGIGKSRLVAFAAERARAERKVVVEGRAVVGLTEPLGVFRDLLRTVQREGMEPRLRDPMAAEFPRKLLSDASVASRQSGNLGASFEACARYLRELAGTRGALVVLEDLHWADAASLVLVPFVTRALRGTQVMTLVTFRPDGDESAPLPAMRTELRRDRLLEEVVLEPLGPADAEAMLAEVVGRTPSADAKTELIRLAGGNPFALEELTRAALESGWLDPATGRRRGTGPAELPWSIADSIRARAAALPAPQRDVLSWAAVLGERFDL